MPTIVRFDCYEVDLAAGQLLKRGAKIRLREQCFQVLAALLERPGQVLTRDELRQRLWPDDVFVDFENNLNTAVARLREALNDSAESPRFIETLPRHGYRFIGILSKETDPAPGSVGAPKSRLLVLPFVSTGDPALEDFSDVVTDGLITRLAALAPDALTVIARPTAMHYKGSRKDAAGIGRELNVNHVLEGTIRRSGDIVAVNAQLIRMSDQGYVWTHRYEGPPGDLSSMQSAVAQAIAAALDVTPDRPAVERAAAARKHTGDPIAYKEYVQGRRCFDAFRTSEDVEKAREHFEHAVAQDPGFILAREALAELYVIQGYLGLLPPGDAFGAGILHAVRALEIDDARAETHALLAQYHKQRGYNWPDIERELRRARDLDPASTLVGWMYVIGWLMPQGRIRDGIAELERALQRDPLSVWVNTWLGIMLVLAHEWDRVIAHTQMMIELDPLSPWGHWLLGAGFRGKGRPDDAIAAFRRAADLSGGWHFMLGWLGLILGISGRVDEARAVLARLEVMARSTYVPPTCFAWVYLGLRDVDRAFEWLERAVDAHDQFLMPIKTYAFFDPIRKDPRFAALLRKMKLD